MEVLTVICAIILGTIVFIGINTIFSIWYLGCGAMIGEWFTCVILSGILVQFLGGIVGGLFSALWFLIKIILIIAVVGGVGMYFYDKVKENKGE